MGDKVKLPLPVILSVARVDEYGVDRVDALEVDVDLREGGDVSLGSTRVHGLGSQVKGIEGNVETLLSHNLVKSSMYLLLKHDHISVDFKLADGIVPFERLI